MKPTILHVISDYKIGGVRSNIENILISRLNQDFNFSVLLIDKIKENKNTLKTVDPDIIVFHPANSWVNILNLLFLKSYAKIIICEHHYYDVFDSLVPSKIRFNLMLKLAYGLADKVIAFSCSQAEWMCQKNSVRTQNLAVIPQARDLEPFLKIPPPQLLQSPLKLGSYGRFSDEKGFVILLNALRLLPPIPVHLYLGGEGPQQAVLENLAEGLPHVELKGVIRDIPGFLQTCDAVVIPSLREMWGYVCMEAKAAARPILASRVGGLVEQIEACDCGILVPPGDPVALAEGIQQLYALPRSSLKAMGQRGRDSVQNAWENYLNQWEQVLWETLLF